jgi:hypothetical protein
MELKDAAWPSPSASRNRNFASADANNQAIRYRGTLETDKLRAADTVAATQMCLQRHQYRRVREFQSH